MANPHGTNPKLDKLRELFRKSDVAGGQIQAYLLPSTDAHQSEYLSDCDFRVRFLSGFSGSNAFALVTNKEAILWTDGRYMIQAKAQLEDGWQLMEEGTPQSISPLDWIMENMESGSRIGFDPQLHTFGDASRMIDSLHQVNITAIPLNGNLVDNIWNNRPKRPSNKVLALEREECGKDSAEKIDEIRRKIRVKKCNSALFTALDDIAWLLNIRGADIPFNPLTYSLLLLTESDVHLFIDENKLTNQQLKEHLLQINLHNYENANEWLTGWHRQQQNAPNYKILLTDATNYALGSIFMKQHSLTAASPIQTMKAVKNDTELRGIRESHIRDSAALVEFFAWLEAEILAGHQVTELMACERSEQFRATKPRYVGLSFETIAGVDGHSALPHYKPSKENDRCEIRKDSVFLLDSGAHYRDGTTDVTRTVTYSDEPDRELIRLNTLVLKGHIRTAKMIFPDGLNGIRIDVISRQFLWSDGMDFGHGVGHGVGHFMNVHEGPVGIGYRRYSPEGAIHRGMILTIEPGCYIEGKWGIRIENCYEVIKAEKMRSGAENFLTFEPLTYVPLQKSLIDKTLLTHDEIDWINEYHSRCLNKVGTYLTKDNMQKAFEWLQKQ